VTLGCRLVHAASSWNVHAAALMQVELDEGRVDSSDAQQQEQQNYGDEEADSLTGQDEFVPLVKSDLQAAAASSSSGHAASNMDDLVSSAAAWRDPAHGADAAPECPLPAHSLAPSSAPVAAASAASDSSSAAPLPLQNSSVKKVVIKLPTSIKDARSAGAGASGAYSDDAAVSVVPSTPSQHRLLQHAPLSVSRGFGAAASALAPSTPGSGAVR
jgi:hypothetical protein